MSRNREPVKPVVESTDTEEDDDEASTEEESDSPPPTQKNSAKPRQTPPQPPSSSSEDSGSETDEPESNVKPKPVDKTPQKSTNGAKKPAAAKRAAAEDVSTPKDAKKKKASDPETSAKKSNLFKRLFTEDDEIIILQGMLDYKSEKKRDPAADLKGFHDFIKKKVRTDFSAYQLRRKIRRLKKKFENNRGKEEKKEGKARHFSKSHEKKSYDLSKLIWANVKENGAEGNRKADSLTPLNKKLNFNGGSGVGGDSSMEELLLKRGREVFEAGQGIEGENEWQNLRVDEIKLYIKQLEIRAAQAKLVLAYLKP